MSVRSRAGTAVPPAVPASPPEPLAAVSVRDVSKAFGHGPSAVVALDRLRLDVRSGEFVCLDRRLGLRQDAPCSTSSPVSISRRAGTVAVDGRAALMFQEAALFPWLTVAGNIELALRLRPGERLNRRARRERAEALLAYRAPRGVRRSAAARAVRWHAPAGRAGARVRAGRRRAADGRAVRRARRDDARSCCTTSSSGLWADRSFTVLFVTHNVREAARLADRVVLLSSRPGRVVEEFTVDIERPRRIDSPEVSGLAAQITDSLREEVRRHA